jgi:hypothetical protein
MIYVVTICTIDFVTDEGAPYSFKTNSIKADSVSKLMDKAIAAHLREFPKSKPINVTAEVVECE